MNYDKNLQKRIKFSPFKAQQEIIDAFNTHRDIRLAAGRRFGKSALCAYFALREFMQNDKHIWIVAPSYELSEKVFNYVVKWLVQSFPKMQRCITTRIPASIVAPYTPEEPWGSWIKCKSADNPSSLLGEELDLIILDEASRIKKEVWDGYMYPCLSSRKGKSVMISTPFGKNWFYHDWVRAQEAADGASFSFSSLDGVSINQEEWDRAKKTLPEQTFKQEFEALFLEDAASVFRGVNDIISDDCLKEPENHKYMLGVDLGKHEDFTVLTVLDKYTHKVVHLERFKKIDWNLQKERIISTCKKYNNARIIIDSTGLGDPISDDLKHHGLIVDDFKISGKTKQQLIDKLSIYIEQKAISIPPNDILINELESYGYQLSDSGNIKYSAPSGLHDDCVISLALAVWGLFSPKTENASKIYRPEVKKVRKFQYK